MRHPRGPVPQAIELTERQRQLPEDLVRRPQSLQCHVTRARIVLQAASGARNAHIAEDLGISVPKVQRWRARWADAFETLVHVEAQEDPKALSVWIHKVLSDAPRSGRPVTFTAEQMCMIMAVACESPEDTGRPVTHWTLEELTEEVMRRGIVQRISSRTVRRFLKRSRS